MFETDYAYHCYNTYMTKHKKSKISAEERHEFAELLRERIYSTITLLAVVIVLWQHASNYTAWGVIGIITGTVGALWLATIIATRMSYRIAHDDNELEEHYQKAASSASGLLTPALLPSVLMLVSMTGLISIKTALLMSVIGLVLSLFLFSLISGRKIARSYLSLFMYSALQMLLGMGVVALKLLIK